MEEDTIGAPLAENMAEVQQDELTGQDVDDEKVPSYDDAMEEIVEDDGAQYESLLDSEFEQNFVYDLYQPLEAGGFFICKICLQVGKQLEFEDKAHYTAHRYKFHGSYNNQIYCPLTTCKDNFGSINFLRRHLLQDHKFPVEVHHQIFANTGEFERWRHIVEQASECRFMMHAKQPIQKRQIMHCSRSEHKMILQSKKHRLPRLRMEKEGACCPAFISFRVNPRTGHVHTFYQLYHVGHDNNHDDFLEDDSAHIKSEEAMSSRLPALHFPERPSFLGERPFQYLQVDLVEMPQALYITTPYYHLLILTDLHTGFKWAKPIPEMSNKQLLIRIITDLFCQYGVPEGFACNPSESQSLIRDTMANLSHVFNFDIKEVLNECTDYHLFRELLIEQSEIELKSEMRWVEMVQFVAMNWNQYGDRSPFEKFFKRTPCIVAPAPWLNKELRDQISHYSEQDDDNLSNMTTRYRVGDHVYLRSVDRQRGRRGSAAFLNGMIADVDWESSQVFPYRILYSREQDLWPDENSEYVWVTPFDILPTTHDLLAIRDEDRQRIVSEFMCGCDSPDGPACPLFRSHLCSNTMSRACCIRSGLQCQFHKFSTGDDSYSKMEMVSRFFSKDCSETEREHIRRSLRNRSPKNLPSSSHNAQSEYSSVHQGEDSKADLSLPVTSVRQIPSILKRRSIARRTKTLTEDCSTGILENGPSTSYLSTNSHSAYIMDGRGTMISRSDNCERLSGDMIECAVSSMDEEQDMFQEEAVEVSEFVEVCDQTEKQQSCSSFIVQEEPTQLPDSSFENSRPGKRSSSSYAFESKKPRLIRPTPTIVNASSENAPSRDSSMRPVKEELEECDTANPPRRSGRPSKTKKFDDYIVD